MLKRYELFSSSVSGIYRCIQRIESEEMEKRGLRGSYAQYLVALKSHKQGLTLSQLSELCMKDKAAVSRAVSEMEQKGLVTRKVTGSNLYRAPLILSTEGEMVADFVSKRATFAVELAGKGLSNENRKVFYEALELISDNLREISKQGLPD